jgi:hypothetical protein
MQGAVAAPSRWPTPPPWAEYVQGVAMEIVGVIAVLVAGALVGIVLGRPWGPLLLAVGFAG